MRDHGVVRCGLVLCGVLFFACGGGDEQKPKTEENPRTKAAAEAQATIAAVPEPTVGATPLPTATPTEEPTPEITPSPLPTSPPEDEPLGYDDLQLLGIVRAGTAPSAVIALDGKQEIFRKGDSVFDRGKIEAVKDDSVVLRRGDEQFTLKIVPAAPAEPVETPTSELVESRPPPAEPAPPPATGPLAKTEVRAALRDLKNHLATAEATRVAVGGGHGVQLNKVEPTSFFAKLGLRTGDVLQKLDGFPVDDPERPPDLSSAAEGNELTIGFTRNEIGLTITRRLQ